MVSKTERFIITSTLFLASMSLAGFMLAIAGISLSPLLILIASSLLTTFLRRLLIGSDKRVANTTNFIFPLATMTGLVFYLLFLAYPSFLPPSESPDLSNHLILINHITETKALPSLGGNAEHLGHMVDYPPGFHIIIATIASITRIPSMYVLYPFVSVVVALQAGILYYIALRIVRSEKYSHVGAVCSSFLVLMPFAYTIGSLIAASYYSMIMTELYVLIMVWIMIRWQKTRNRGFLKLYSLLGIAALVTWPWACAIFLSIGTVTLLTKSRMKERLIASTITYAPLIFAAALYFFAYPHTLFGYLQEGGIVIEPTIQSISMTLLIFSLIGIVLLFRYKEAKPLLYALLVTLFQLITLLFISQYGIISLYAPYKTINFLVYFLVIAASVTLIFTTRLLRSFSWIIPVGMVLILVIRGLPTHAPSPISYDMHKIGLEKAVGIPQHCLGYYTHGRIRAYWFHTVMMKGSPSSDRAKNILYYDAHSQSTTQYSYLVVDDVSGTPEEIDPSWFILRHGTAALLKIPGVECIA